MKDITIDYNLGSYFHDGSITVEYIGSDENKKTIVKNIHDTLYELFRKYELFNKKEVEEIRFTRSITGVFLIIYVKGDEKIVTTIVNSIETYIQVMDEYENKIMNMNMKMKKSK